MLIYDLLVVKTVGIPAIVSSHECFSSSMFWRDTGVLKKIHVYKIADLVIVLTHVDLKFWTLFGIKTVCTPNPLFSDINKIQQSKLDALNIIWVGRFSIEKRYVEPIHIFAEVVREMPEAKLIMLGKGESSVQKNELKSEIERLGLTENVVLCGYFKDISHFYLMSSVYLTTSYHESFSMALIESRAFGIPSVAYELPNVDILDEKKGVILVSQGDKNAAARAIIQMLSDQEFRIKKGIEARKSTEVFYKKNNVKEEWNKILNKTIFTKKMPVANPENNEEIYLRMFQSILLHYGLGLTHAPMIANTAFIQSPPDPPLTSAFAPDTTLPQCWPVPIEVMRSVENLTDHPGFVMHEGEDVILVHPIDNVPALGRLNNACPTGTQHIQAEVLIAAPVDIEWQSDIQQFTAGFCSEWVTVPADGRSAVHLFLPAPLESTAHLYLATRLRPGEINTYCWAHFRNICMTL